MSTDLLVIVDDDSDAFSYGLPDSSWSKTAISPLWYKATSHFPVSNSTVTFTFNGTSAAFTGGSPGRLQVPTFQIDNGSLSNISDLDPSAYRQWFTTPTLSDGRHTITIGNLSTDASVDYVVVKVGTQTSLSGQTIIVDDDSSLIQYSGQWSRSTNVFTTGSGFTSFPHGNTTHRSSNPGDTFTFRFSGRSIAIYGIFSHYNVGSLSVTFSIDGTPYPAFFSLNTSSPENGEISNHLYFSRDVLLSGPHTVLVNITEVNNHIFTLDYITYNPAFDTLSSMPPLSSGNSSTAVPSSSTASGSHQSVSTGAVVGGVLGGVAFIVLVVILVLILRRRRAREQHAYSDAALRDLNDPNIVKF